jgi:hypothetical protein
MRRTGPDGHELGPDAFVFGNEVGEPVKSVRIAWEKARDAAGLNGLQLRDLGHEAGSRFDEAGVPTLPTVAHAVFSQGERRLVRKGDSDPPSCEIFEIIQQFESLNPPEPPKWADRDT